MTLLQLQEWNLNGSYKWFFTLCTNSHLWLFCVEVFHLISSVSSLLESSSRMDAPCLIIISRRVSKTLTRLDGHKCAKEEPLLMISVLPQSPPSISCCVWEAASSSPLWNCWPRSTTARRWSAASMYTNTVQCHCQTSGCWFGLQINEELANFYRRSACWPDHSIDMPLKGKPILSIVAEILFQKIVLVNSFINSNSFVNKTYV